MLDNRISTAGGSPLDFLLGWSRPLLGFVAFAPGDCWRRTATHSLQGYFATPQRISTRL